ncbi:MAG: PD-(D/E)XK nuclease family protein [Chlorobi bacterium]|nr:PD-(D/E)XK nuclease family protein [Chlorobiota bacterium]
MGNHQLETTLFEYLGVADMERIHSQTLAWIFSKKCKALNNTQRKTLIYDIFGIEDDCSGIETITEFKHIDIVIKLDNHVIYIENKIKSGLSNKQLERYNKFIEATTEFGERKPKKYYLTLYDMKDNDRKTKKWNNIQYKTIIDALPLNVLAPNNDDSVMLEQYVRTLENIYYVCDTFLGNPKEYSFVFIDGSKKTSEKTSEKWESTDEVKNYIRDFRLETYLQKLFLTEVSQKLMTSKLDVKWEIRETHGNALISGILMEDDTINYHFGFQNKAIILWFNDRGLNNEDRSRMVEKAFEFGKEKFGYTRLNKKKQKHDKSNISISKTMIIDNGYEYDYKMSVTDFAAICKKEMKIATEIFKHISAEKLAEYKKLKQKTKNQIKPNS